MSTSIDFTGKVALVTGAARGIGAAAARAYAEANAKVVLSDILPEVSELAQEIIEQGGTAEYLVADISRSSECKALVELAMGKLGRLDFAFNNAGISGEMKPLADSTEEEWDRMIAVNLSSVYHCMRYQIPAMLKNGGGVIINTSSICGSRPVYGLGPYVAAKHGVKGLSSSVALDYGSQGIRCVSIGPGFIETEMTRAGLDAETAAALEARIPQGRLGQPEDIGRVVRLLCSEDASYINGAYLPVDGGLLLS
jgi:NAD(P)-dependent dehydrogenase (short-subunit alcohol dehydrogenase family)